MSQVSSLSLKNVQRSGNYENDDNDDNEFAKRDCEDLWPETWHLRHWLHFWQLRTTILTITLWPLNKEWQGQHLQFLRCFRKLNQSGTERKRLLQLSRTSVFSWDLGDCVVLQEYSPNNTETQEMRRARSGSRECLTTTRAWVCNRIFFAIFFRCSLIYF